MVIHRDDRGFDYLTVADVILRIIALVDQDNVSRTEVGEKITLIFGYRQAQAMNIITDFTLFQRQIMQNFASIESSPATRRSIA